MSLAQRRGIGGWQSAGVRFALLGTLMLADGAGDPVAAPGKGRLAAGIAA